MSDKEITKKIRNGEIDINNQSHFFSFLIKGLLVHLNKDISIRNTPIPHYIVNTGNEFMMQEVKGYDHSKDPIEVTNESYIYTTIPRCAVTPKGIQLISNQLTSPYSNGQLQLEYDGQIISYVSEMRRMPLKMTFELKYIVSSYTDTLELVQQIITKLAFVQHYNIVYMGQGIVCSYNLPDSLDDEKVIEFDGNYTDDRRHSVTFDIEVETNMPIYHPGSVISSSDYITNIDPDMPQPDPSDPSDPSNPSDPSDPSNPSDPNIKNTTPYRLRVLPVGGLRKGDVGEDPSL